MSSKEHYDLVGIGCGPGNLSIASLCEFYDKKTIFMEKQSNYRWHSGMLIDDTYMQTSFLKDLVTPVAPQSTFSFLAYLVDKNKFYSFISLGLNQITRSEFSDYLSWVTEKNKRILLGHEVKQVNFMGDMFEIISNQRTIYSKHISIGLGIVPMYPNFCRNLISDTLFHSSQFKLKHLKRNFSGKRILIIGGGQSGADIVLSCLNDSWGTAKSVSWISRRDNFQQLDEAVFSNEYFTPDYTSYFNGLSDDIKQEIFKKQKLTSDGISQDTLLNIYRKIYYKKHVLRKENACFLSPNKEVVNISYNKGIYNVSYRDLITKKMLSEEADIVILATGYKRRKASFLNSFLDNKTIDSISDYIKPDYSLDWEHEHANKIFLINSSSKNHGIADAQLSLIAWRAATVLNTISDKQMFNVNQTQGLLDWKSQQMHQYNNQVN